MAASIANTTSAIPAESGKQSLARFAWLTLAYNVAVILWGAYVRATGSGAGCGGHWPLCNGAVIPRAPQTQTVIEFTHRITSATAVAMALLLLIWCLLKTKKGDWSRRAAIVATLLLFNEALLGALLVLLDHVGMDQSAGRAIFLALHFGNTLLLLAALTLTARWLSSPDRNFAATGRFREWIGVGLGLTAVAITGVTGSLAALGDALFPSTSLQNSLIQDFSANSHALLRLRILHPIAASIAAIFVLWLIRKFSSPPGKSHLLASLLAGILSMQLLLGVLNVVLLAPVWLQIIHLLVADLLWIFLILASTDILVRKIAIPDELRQTNTAHALPSSPQGND